MKKIITLVVALAGVFAVNAQQAYETPSFGSNWSIGLDGGVTTPLESYGFWRDMRGTFGLHIQKQVSPVVAIGVEGSLGVNTSSWNQKLYQDVFADYYMVGKSSTAFDNSYVGAYGAFNLFNLFGGYKCDGRLFDMEVVAGAGWGHEFFNKMAMYPLTLDAKDQNYFVTKVGVNFNFNVCEHLTVSLKPSVAFNMTGTHFDELDVAQTSAAYTKRNAAFNLLAGVTYNFGPGFQCVDTKNQGEIDALNAEINALRAAIEAAKANQAAAVATAGALENELDACKKQGPVVKEVVSNNLQSVRYVFYKIGSSVITADQMPNVEMVASYLKNHEGSKVVVKGYASPDGPKELNIKLAAARAESVKNALIKKYGIAADRIQAEGKGIGDMFTENDWNRVSICTLED